MDRPIGRQTQILNVRLPLDLYEEFVSEAGEGYGARSDLMRRMIRFWLDGRELRQVQDQNRALQQQVYALQARLRQIRELV